MFLRCHLPCMSVSDQTFIHVLTCVSQLHSSIFLLSDLDWNHRNLYNHKNLSHVFHCVCPKYKFSEPVLVVDVVSFETSVSDFCGLTVGCFPLCPTHWASRVDVMGGYHEYTDVRSCQDVVHLYHLLWSATILNIVALFLGIITAAVLGGFKDMVCQCEW